MNDDNVFMTWLQKQSNRDDSIGDLARDFIADPNKDAIKSYISFQAYLIRRNACEEAINALSSAYLEYQDDEIKN